MTVSFQDLQHPAVLAFYYNFRRYHEDAFLSFIDRVARRNPHLDALRESEQYKAITWRVTENDPFSEMMAVLPELSIAELQWLVDNMPSGYQRARVMEHLDKQEIKDER